MPCRHCAPLPDDVTLEWAQTYSAALFGAELRPAIEDLESHGIVPSIVAFCPQCGRSTVVVERRSPDAYAHVLWLHRLTGAFLNGAGQGACG